MTIFKSEDKLRPVGFFDSGVGGISVLKEALLLMPHENFLYLGDSKNAPYGTKNLKDVKELSFKAVDFLLSHGAKAIVVACNTATSVAINDLREKYENIPIIGIEPALKPAVELNPKGKIIIMATPMTLSEKKFNNLMKKYEDTVPIYPLPCPGLVELIENEVIEGDELNSFLSSTLGKVVDEEISSVVLGCTHYPFIKAELSKIIGEDIPIIDGSNGTAKQLQKLLIQKELLNNSDTPGKIQIYNSLEDHRLIDFSYRLLRDNK